MNPHHKNRYGALAPNQGTYLPPLEKMLGVSHYPPSVENQFLHHNTQVPSNSRHGEGALQSDVGVYNQRYFFNADRSNSQVFFQQHGLQHPMRTVSNIPLGHENNNLDRLNFLEAGLTQYTSSCSINPLPFHDDSSNTNNRSSDSFQEDKIPENPQNNHQNYFQNSSKKNKRKNLLTKRSKLRKIGNNDTNKQFVLRDYQNICTYLEDTNNYKALFGEVKKTRIGEPLMTKTAAFSLFVCYLNNQNRGLNLTGRNCQQRFATYKAKYIATNRFSKETGAGLTMEELGGLTLSAKLETMCPCYDRMDQLFGHKANVQPAFAIDSGKIAGDDIVDCTSIGNAFEESISITSEEDFISDWDESQPNDSHSKKLDDDLEDTTNTCQNVNEESVTKNIKKVENTRTTNMVKKGRCSDPPEASQGFKKIKMEKAPPVLKPPQADLKLLFLKDYAEAEQKHWAEEQKFKKEQLERESELQRHKSENQRQKAESRIKLKEKERRRQAIDNWMKDGKLMEEIRELLHLVYES